MMVKDILKGCDVIKRIMADDILERDILGIAYDSRQVKDDYIFVAISGAHVDGHTFIREAAEKGATVIVGEQEASTGEARYILVEDSRKALACMANNFYGRPSESLEICGITGTNGKTTTAFILKSILESWGKNVGVIGTIRYLIGNKEYPAFHTTPEAPEFQGLLREMVVAGCTHAVAEISSHALAQHRVENTVFRTAVFTNLTRDHLDFHETMEDYFRAKERLFIDLLDRNGTAIINCDDGYGRRLASQLKESSPDRSVITYGFHRDADIVACSERITPRGTQFTIQFRKARYEISSQLLGLPNIYNMMSAAAAAYSLGVPWETIVIGISGMGTVPGRFEKVEAGQGFLCILDYAHTEDALERVITSARRLITRTEDSVENGSPYGEPRIISVFGCGGDRDRGKRPRMGEVSSKLSDFVIITSDNPRSEDPLEIIRQMEEGMVKDNYLIEPDRRKAIQKAVQIARDGDIVLVAGKGHEDYQIIGERKIHFDDREEAAAALKTRERER